MASRCLHLNLEPFLSSDVIDIILSYITINCNNCTKQRIDLNWSNKYKKCNGWLCIQCDRAKYYSQYLY